MVRRRHPARPLRLRAGDAAGPPCQACAGLSTRRPAGYSAAGPGPAQSIRSDVVAVAGDANGTKLATVHLTGGDPYSFTAPILAWAAGKAATDGVRPAGALGPVEAFGAADLENACAAAGLHRERSKSGSTN
jgi:hypothetical protein